MSLLGKQIAVVAGAMAVAFGVSACSPTVDEPLTAEQAGFLLASLDKPTSLAKFSLESPGDFQDAYGDQEDVVQTFESASPECAAVSDLEVLTRFAPGGNDYRKFLPSKLRGFDTMNGVEFGVKTPEGADASSYASVGVAVLTFGSAEEAVEYTSTIRTNVEPCFDFKEEQVAGDDFVKRSLDLMRFTEAEEGPPNFSYETVSVFAFSYSGLDISTSYDQISSVHHYGPNVVVVHSMADEDAGAELGITNDELQDGFDSIFLQIDELIFEALDS